jgi:hypothetical protein
MTLPVSARGTQSDQGIRPGRQARPVDTIAVACRLAEEGA